MRNSTVSLTIEQLTLEGFSHSEALRVRDAFEQELQRAVAEKQGAVQMLKVDAREKIHCEIQSQSPEQIGKNAAQSLAQQLAEDLW